MLTKQDYVYLYDITTEVTPLKKDCGVLCNSICCRQDKSESLGMYLFPGEECMFSGNETWLTWEKHDRDKHLFPQSWPQTIYFVKCTGQCSRNLRPLACRFFPLAPHFYKDKLFLIYETLSLPYSCPLITGHTPLQPAFIDTVATCWQLMLTDYRIRDLVEEDSWEREAHGQTIEIIWNETESWRSFFTSPLSRREHREKIKSMKKHKVKGKIPS